ncbi:Undecaprenyl phosphate-aminoarabinose flippase subunit ArnF [Pragia fontium]|uniref:4-amino-4-deoxy-L-arabinose-phosphoundecaprenol flippase subunit ArnF n=1 Tax=Pragia fontium TaxID=82985 RepID=UPI000DFA518D|nr:4-amino-4-deoxy-L-arabinose-phosphoundecaprenol flippase subunit ArnF [Pragia fontium]SUB83830.1 Undecaprenyl phosphate-aminoarabinose flippase subunit ArnF [Pragia fontium]
MKGYGWAVGSILLASCAQLLMKWGMTQLPQSLLVEMGWLSQLSDFILPLLAVGCGILFYVVSMACWFFTLRYLPLNKAYPLLSISYGVVYLGAILLPWFQEPFSFIRTAGIVVIIIGVWVINRPRSQSS